MNWEYILQALPRFVDASIMTLHLAFWGIVLSLLIGLFCAVIMTYKVNALSWLVKGYIELSRNTPLLIQVFFLYFGLSKNWDQVRWFYVRRDWLSIFGW